MPVVILLMIILCQYNIMTYLDRLYLKRFIISIILLLIGLL
jgi:hypothetical protein